MNVNNKRAIELLPKAEQHKLLRRERFLRDSGQWPKWQKLHLPHGIRETGWSSQVRLVYKNDVFSVLVRKLEDGAFHLAIGSLSGIRPTWPEMQRIKNELAGEKWQAIEIYPPQNEVVDEAPMYHLWVLPKPLPYSLFEGG